MQGSSSNASGLARLWASGAIFHAVAVILAQRALFAVGRLFAANGVPPRPLKDVLENARCARAEAA
jgi:hypothetical protein